MRKMTLKEAAAILSRAEIENPLYDARVIFSEIGGIPLSRLVLEGEVEDGSPTALAIERRALRIPLEYVIGSVDFYREKYLVGEGCLIPRDDTELLVDFAVKNIPHGASFVDLCTGSGCIALSVLNNTEATRAAAVDISPEAIAFARKNAERLGLLKRVELRLCDALSEPVTERCFAVLSNPPYVTESEYPTLSREIKHEPKIAFVGGENGLIFYRVITEKYKGIIDKEGFIAFEIGATQAAALREIAEKNEMSCEIVRDLSGNDRLAVLRRV